MAENYKNDVEKLKHHLAILLDAETSLPAEPVSYTHLTLPTICSV